MLTKTIESLLVIVIVVTAVTSVAAQSQPNATSQKVTKEELDTRFEIARSLVREKKYEEALKEYLFIFDNSREVSSYGGVRLSYVPSEIAELGLTYRPAKLALQARRDEREKLVLAGKGDFDVVHELTSLNGYLDEPERNIALFDKLKPMGPAYAETRENFLSLIWEQLVALKRYDELKGKIDDVVRQLVTQIAEAAVINDFPDQSVRGTPEYRQFLRNTITDDGGRIYETLLALGQTEKAGKLAKWMLTYASDGEMYAQLINSAINANRTDIAADLVERANKNLKREEDLRVVQEAARRLPKAK